MVNYTKRVVILKEITPNYTLNNKTFRGSCLIENKENITTFNFDFLCPIKSGLTIYICCDNENITTISIPNKEMFSVNFDNLPIKNGVVIAIFDSINLIFYGKSGETFYDVEHIKKHIKKNPKIYENIKNNENQIKSDTSIYNDEVIATENYYKIENERKYLHSEDANEFITNSQKQQNKEDATKLREYEKNIRPFEAWDFYSRVKSSLESIFSSYPAINNFDEIFYGSKFVKIHYADNKFYYVGKIFENGILKYICYGVEGEYNSPFNDGNNTFTFIPKSKFNLMGEGYFVIFQNAQNGEILNKN